MSDIVVSKKNEMTTLWNQDQIDAIKNTLCPNLSNDELTLFAQICQKTGLDPFSRQIYVIKTRVWDSNVKTYKEKMQTMTSIDGFRVIAERSKDYAGQVGPFWCGKDGVWKDVWLSNEIPMASKVGVLRKEFKEPLFRVCLFSEFSKKNKDGSLGGQWASMPTVMIAKCAESQALRAAFPNDLSGLYTAEEMGQADNEKEAPRKVPNEVEIKHPLIGQAERHNKETKQNILPEVDDNAIIEKVAKDEERMNARKVFHIKVAEHITKEPREMRAFLKKELNYDSNMIYEVSEYEAFEKKFMDGLVGYQEQGKLSL